MSIATEIQRLNTAKADIKAAIEAKGVTVPSSATIDTYDDYVSQISGGGGGVPMPSNLSSASFNENGIIQSLTFTASTVPNNAYKGNIVLSSVTLSSGVTSIGSNSFSGCSSLTNITINTTTLPSLDNLLPKTILIYVPCDSVHTYRTAKTWNNSANLIFSNDPNCQVESYKARFYDVNDNLIVELQSSTATTGQNITSSETSSYASSTYRVELGDAFIRIQDGAFKGFTHITNLSIGNNVVHINPPFVSGCTSLQTLELPSEYSSYLNTNFATYCNSLQSVTIPSGTTFIESDAINNCTSLQSITILKTNGVLTINGNTTVFKNTNNCPIYVPSDLVNTYKSASKWSTIASRIQAIPNS